MIAWLFPLHGRHPDAPPFFRSLSYPMPTSTSQSPDATVQASQPTPQAFLKHFPDCWIQYFDDGPGKDSAKALSTSDFDPKEASRKQNEGCGVFFSPNGFDGLRRAENLKTVQAAFVDLDLVPPGADGSDAGFEKRLRQGLEALLAFPLPPHVVVRTRNGL
ncbi:MAG: hypothetical protein ACRC33_23180, partial [Gemmataceae bacterium]